MALNRRSNLGFGDHRMPFFDDPFKGFLMPVITNVPRSDDMTLLRSSPGYEINEHDGKYLISVDVPGCKRTDMNIDVEEEGKVLHIHGGRKILRGGKSTETKFSKRFTIGDNVDIDKMTASLSDGVLTLTAPIKKKEEMKPKRIAITEGPMEVEEKKDE